jgi:aminopeptidase 2
LIYLLLWLLGSSAAGAEELWEWTRANWGKVEEAVPASMQAVILRLCLDGLSTESQIDNVKTFFAGCDTKAYDQALGQAMEAMGARKAWAERDGNDVREWLKEHGYM